MGEERRIIQSKKGTLRSDFHFHLLMRRRKKSETHCNERAVIMPQNIECSHWRESHRGYIQWFENEALICFFSFLLVDDAHLRGWRGGLHRLLVASAGARTLPGKRRRRSNEN